MVVGVWFAVVLGASACASTGSRGEKRRLQNAITFAELDGQDAVDCYHLIQRLRPRWLRARGGGTPEVFIDGAQLLGGVHALRGMPFGGGVEEIRFLSALDATTKFGTGYVNGAILITTGVREVGPEITAS